uniref:poly [ADP-ribose] polymerase 2 n=1 Tax=Myxine glutinosa TaxID=7769 RepID=UPI00358E448D
MASKRKHHDVPAVADPQETAEDQGDEARSTEDKKLRGAKRPAQMKTSPLKHVPSQLRRSTRQKQQSKVDVETPLASGQKRGRTPSATKNIDASKKVKLPSERAEVETPETSTSGKQNDDADQQAPSKRKRTKNGDEDKKTEQVEVRTMVVKGKAPVDAECKQKVGKAHVYCEGDDVYDALLNQTNLQFNNNKYYIIQLLRDDISAKYSVWMRWGRVGKSGQNSLVNCGCNLLSAKQAFNKKFSDKTNNEWEKRSNFKKVPGKYDLVQVDYSASKGQEKTEVDSGPARALPPSCLHPRVLAVLETLCNIQLMERAVVEMKYDIKKAPLGKLTEAQIKAGYSALCAVEKALHPGTSRHILLRACNDFYTRIPHDFGMKTPPLICSKHELQEKLQLLEALGEIEVAVKLLESDEAGRLEHPADAHYRALQCQMNPVDPSSSEYQIIEKYLQTTHAKTHMAYTMSIIDLFAVEREGERERFLSDIGNSMLLWHGSRLSNWIGILSHGLKIAPPEAPSTGYMFGKGMYFADMSSKSANYCFATMQSDRGFLLLSEVMLGECQEMMAADYHADRLPAGKHSTKGIGRSGPDAKNYCTMNGAVVPLGPVVDLKTDDSKGSMPTLLYNEFVVYRPEQVRMAYLLHVRFNFTSAW